MFNFCVSVSLSQCKLISLPQKLFWVPGWPLQCFPQIKWLKFLKLNWNAISILHIPTYSRFSKECEFDLMTLKLLEKFLYRLLNSKWKECVGVWCFLVLIFLVDWKFLNKKFPSVSPKLLVFYGGLTNSILLASPSFLD